MENYTGQILKIFKDCLSKRGSEEESILVQGLAHEAHLNPNKLEEHKEEINEMLDNILAEGEIIRCSDFCYTKSKMKWGTANVVEMLLILGLATNILSFSNVENRIRDINGLPFITRIKKEKDNVLKHSK